MDQVNRQALLDVLTSVLPGLAKKELVPNSTCFVFKKGIVTTYNDSVSIRTRCPIEATFAVPAKPFYNLISKLPDEVLEWELRDNEFFIKAAKGGRSGVKTKADAKLPVSELGDPGAWTELPPDFSAGLKIAAITTVEESSRPQLSYIQVKGDRLNSTDAKRITSYTMDSEAPDMMVPAAVVDSLSKYELAACGNTKGWLHFKTKSNAVFSCRTAHPDTKFPDISAHLKIDGVELKLPSDLKDILDRASVFSSEVEKLSAVNFLVVDEKMTIKGKGPSGWFKKTKKAPGATPVEFDINVDFLKHIIGQTESVFVSDKTVAFKAGKVQAVMALVARKAKQEVEGEAE